MRLIIRQYLESLKERGELDALIPDLCSQMGLEVILRPGVGARQYGVDVAAVGKLTGEQEEKVFLFSIKSGDLGRKDWDGGNPQDLRPSIIEIIEVFIPNHMPAAHRDKPVVICLCFGGDVKEDVRLNVSAFTVKHAAANLTFSEWNGDHLTLLVEQYFLREELLPPESRSLLRKSLALIDEPDISFKHFNTLLRSIHSQDRSKPKDFLTAIRQMHISMWILYSWCREEDNLESAYLSSEVLFLLGWDLCKGFVGKNTKVANQIFETLDAIMLLYVQVTMSYVDKVLGKHRYCDGVPVALSEKAGLVIYK